MNINGVHSNFTNFSTMQYTKENPQGEIEKSNFTGKLFNLEWD
jgi:hypothetical protein